MRLGNNDFLNPTDIKVYESPLIAVTGAANENITWSHNLGFLLTDIEVEAVCVAADNGYVAGNVMPLSNIQNIFSSSTSSQEFGFNIKSATDEIVLIGGNTTSWFVWYAADTGNMTTFTEENWRIRLRGKKIVQGDSPDITRVGLVPLKTYVVNSGDADAVVDLTLADSQNYDIAEIEILQATPATDGVNLVMRTSSDGTTFDNGASDYNYLLMRAINATQSNAASAATSEIITGSGSGTSVEEHFTGTIKVVGKDDPNRYTDFNWVAGGRDNGGNYRAFVIYSTRKETAVVKAVRLFWSTGNWERGTIILYGKRKVA